jgi:hypothetical protein
MIEILTTLQAIEVLAESTRDAGIMEQEHKHKKHKKDKKHKDEKSKKHRRDKERKHTKDGLLRGSAGGDGRETHGNGLVANGVAAANVESCRATKADSEPESGEIPVENSHAENKLVTAPAQDPFAEDCLPPATVHPKEVEGPKRCVLFFCSSSSSSSSSWSSLSSCSCFFSCSSSSFFVLFFVPLPHPPSDPCQLHTLYLFREQLKISDLLKMLQASGG